MTDVLYEEALAHFGVKGMKWGQRKERTPVTTYSSQSQASKVKVTKSEFKRELKNFRAEEKQNMKNAKKDSTFRREVRAAKKGEGVTKALDGNVDFAFLKGGYTTARINANFKNSKGEKVSKEFANAVMDKAVSEQRRKDMMTVGLVYLTAAGIAVAAGKVR